MGEAGLDETQPEADEALGDHRVLEAVHHVRWGLEMVFGLFRLSAYIALPCA